jgi:hypothetical protein
MSEIKVRVGSENKIRVIPSIGAATLGALNDVDTSNLDNGYILVYDNNTNRWTATNILKGIYYQAGDFSTNGINYFDTNGLMKSTVAPGAGINTSNYILTTDASGVPTWTDTIDGGTF